MKKKLLILLLTVVAALCCALCFAGCGRNSNNNLPSGNTGDTNTPDDDTGHTHDWGEWQVTTSATCTTQGEETRVCKTNSTHKETRKTTVDPTAHTYGDLIEIQPATCSATGTKAHYHCACGKYFNEDKTEITEENLVIAKDPTAHKYNTENKCELCNYILEYTQGLEYEINSDNTAYTLSGIGQAEATDIVIPYYYEGLPVTAIGEKAFYNCINLTSITLPESITSIGKSAFEKCTSLTGVYITDIAAWCNIEFNDSANPLEYAHKLYLNNELVTEITAAMLQGLTKIKDLAFDGCTSLTSIIIPDSVTSIGGAFYNSVTSIGGAFYNCTSLESVTIPDSVTSIGACAFWNCTSLESVTIPNSVTSIGSYAFYWCTSLTSITIPNSVTSIGACAFWNCTSLESVTIGNGVTSIGGGVFNGCTSLTSITIGNGVTSIGYEAFYGCSSLESVNFSDNSKLKSISKYAFYGCSNLTGVYITDIAAWCNIEFSSGSYTNPLYYARNLYLNDTLVTEITADMLQGVTEIKDYAFEDCDSLTSITIPDSVTSIGEEAFSWCTRLESITIGDSVTSIGYEAFYGCTSLTSITIPDSVTFIGDYAFCGCTSLESATIGDGVTSIGYEAFYGCSSLESVKFENTADWKVSTSSSMSNAKNVNVTYASENAKLLSKSSNYGGYSDYYWKRYDI